jgi:hypothetical protein
VTVGERLAQRTPALPAPLDARLRTALRDRMGDPASGAYDALLSTAESLLAELLTLDCATRDHAIDLLAVDALITYAFEAAADAPHTLSARAVEAMGAIAALVSPALRA